LHFQKVWLCPPRFARWGENGGKTRKSLFLTCKLHAQLFTARLRRAAEPRIYNVDANKRASKMARSLKPRVLENEKKNKSFKP